MTPAEQEVLDRVLSSNQNEESEAEKVARQEARRIRQRRKMTAAYKAHKALEALHPEEYARFYDAAFDALGKDERYSSSQADLVDSEIL